MKKIMFLLLAVCLSVLVVLAVPNVPNLFTGTVTYSEDSSESLIGSEISATVGGSSIGVLGVVEEGNMYKVLVDPQSYSGEIIFYVGGVEASPSTTYEMGAFTDLDLFIDEMPVLGTYCGNGLVEVGEQCEGENINSMTCEQLFGAGWTGTITCTDLCSFDVSGCVPPVASDGDDGGSSNNDDSSGGGGGGGGGSGSNDDEEIIGYVPFDTKEDSSKTETEETDSAAKTQDVLTVDSGNEEERNTLWNMLTGAVVGTNGKVKTSFLLIAIASLGLLAVAFGGLMYCKSKRKK